MTAFIVGYFATAVVLNCVVSYIVTDRLIRKCGNRKFLYMHVTRKFFDHSERWIENRFNLPLILVPFVKQIFFPFNIAATIGCYKDSCEFIANVDDDSADILDESEEEE